MGTQNKKAVPSAGTLETVKTNELLRSMFKHIKQRGGCQVWMCFQEWLTASDQKNTHTPLLWSKRRISWLSWRVLPVRRFPERRLSNCKSGFWYHVPGNKARPFILSEIRWMARTSKVLAGYIKISPSWSAVLRRYVDHPEMVYSLCEGSE